MPQYSLICSNESCENHDIPKDHICSYETMKNMKCQLCGSDMIQKIGKSEFRIYGACEKNGWYPEKMNYDGSKPDW